MIGAVQSTDKPRKRKIPSNEKKYEGIFACCVAGNCKFQSLTSV